MAARVEKQETDARRFARAHALLMRAPLLSSDARFLFCYVVARQSPPRNGQPGKPCCWASMNELQRHFRRFDPKRQTYTGGSRGRVVAAIRELELHFSECFRVERVHGSGRNRYFAKPFHEWPDPVLVRLEESYAAMMSELKPTREGSTVLGPSETCNGPRTDIGPKTSALPGLVLWTPTMEKKLEVGEVSGDSSTGELGVEENQYTVKAPSAGGRS